ncbi:MAG: YdjY domain-containing protein [Candidatus Binatia bacterium]|nr:YdjY domain-containing protein [Candidatus Binatia bacterium]
MRVNILLSALLPLVCWGLVREGQGGETPSLASPLVVVPAAKEVRLYGTIYPSRFNAARGEEARYHLLVWRGGTSPHALIETPADDLAFHDALVTLGGTPGENMTMAAWQQRHEQASPASRAKVTGSPLEIWIAWAGNATGIPIARAFRSAVTPVESPHGLFAWRFGGNRARWFNRLPFASRPGCLVCLYSCPSGKVSNAALSIHDYVTLPGRFSANEEELPPDGTPVIVVVRLLA